MESNSEGATDRKEDVMSTNADAEHDEFLEGREEIPEATNENNENESQQLEEVEVKDDEGKEENIEMDVGTSADNEIVVVEDMKELANEADKAEEKEVEVVEEKEQTEVSEMEISETVEVAEVPPVNETENNTEGKQGDEVQEMENVEIGNLASLADAAIEAQKVSMRLNDKALLNELESNYVAVRNERDSLRTANDHQVSQISSLQKSVQDLQAKLSEKEQQMGQAQSTAETEKNWRLHAEQQTEIHKEKVDRMAMEADSLRNEISQLSTKNTELSSQINEYQTSSEHALSEAIPLRYEKERLQKQLESMSAHSTWLETELANRTSELSIVQKKHGIEMQELKGNLEKNISDKDSHQTQCKILLQDKSDLQNQVEELHTKLREQLRSHTDAKAIAEEGFIAERRVSSLLQDKCTRLEQRFEDAQRTMQGMKELAQRASLEEEQQRKRLMALAEKEMEESLVKIQDLENALKDMDRKKRMAEKALQDKHAADIRKRKLLHEKYGVLATNSTALDKTDQADSSSTAIVEHSGSHEMETEFSPHSLPIIPTLISLTDLYERLAETEDELNSSRAETNRLNVYLQKICVEMEGSAPKIRQQQHEYRIALKERDIAHQRLEEALKEADSAHRESEDLATDLDRATKELKELRVENRDLAGQVQTLLGSRMEMDNANRGDRSNELLGFTSVVELQQQNQNLLREHHRLSETASELRAKLDQSSLQNTLTAVQEELDEMKEERSRQTTLVAGIVQQRDLYRALLAKHDVKLLTEAENQPPPDPLKDKQDAEELTKVKSDLFVANTTIASLEGRVARLDAHTLDLTSSVDKLNSELSAANATVARSQAEVKYHSEKCSRLEESLKSLQGQVLKAEGSASEMNNINTDLQRVISEARMDASRYEQELNQAKAKLNLLETQLKTAEAAETRLIAETNSLQSELSRRGALLDSVQRIEASLASRSASDTQLLENELNTLKEASTLKESKHTDEIETANNKMSALELNIVNLQKARDEAMSVSVKAKDESLGLQTQVKFLEGKSNKLEKSLEEATEKLKELQPQSAGAVDEKKQKIASLSEELNKVRAELQTARERSATYQEIAKKTEKDMADLTKVTDQYKKDKSEEIEKLAADLNSCKKDADAKQIALVDLGKYLADQRSEQEKSESLLKVRISSLEDEIDSLKKDSLSSKERLSALSTEIDTHRDSALNAQKNYERELDLHSAARSELRKARSDLDVEIRRRESSESNFKALQFEFDEKQKLWVEEKSKLEKTIKEVERRLEESREQNKLLHNQMNTLTETVEKFQSDKIKNATTDETQEEKSSNMTTDKDQTTKLEKSVAELREMVRFMQSEREILDAQLDALRHTAERERATSAVAKRSLDEARVELELLQKRAKTGEGDVHSHAAEADKENKNLMKKSDEQITLLRESNALLREESERMRAKLDSAQKELDEVKNSLGPSELKVRELEVDLAAAASEKESLSRQIESWKGRMQNFVSKFQMIDPEEHAKAVELSEKLKKECENLTSLKEKAEQASANAKTIVSRLNREVSQQKSSLAEANSKHAKIVAEKDATIKASTGVSDLAKKERDELKESVKKLESELETTKAELTATKGRFENLTRMLKQYKVKMVDLNKQTQEALTNEKEAQKALAKEQEALKSLKEEAQKAQLAQKEDISTTGTQAVVTKIAKASNVADPVKNTKSNNNETIGAFAQIKSSETKLGTGIKADDATNTKPVQQLVNDGKEKNTNIAEIQESKSSTPPIDVPAGGFQFVASAKQNIVQAGASLDTHSTVKGSKIESSVPSGKDEKEAITSPPSAATSLSDKGPDTIAKPAAKKSKIIKLGTKSSNTNTLTSSSELKPVPESKVEAPKTPESKDLNTLRAKLLEKKRKLSNLQSKEVAATPSKETEESSNTSVTPSKVSNEDKTASITPSTGAPKPVKKPLVSASGLFSSTIESSQTSALEKKTPEVATKATGFGSASSGSTSFGAAFGSSRTGAFGSGLGKSATGSTPTFGGGTFLNLKPPGSNSATNLTFGSSSSIRLPMPLKQSLTAPQMPFGVFGQGTTTSKQPVFGSATSSSTLLFGSKGNNKRSLSTDQEESISKQARLEEDGEIEESAADTSNTNNDGDTKAESA